MGIFIKDNSLIQLNSIQLSNNKKRDEARENSPYKINVSWSSEDDYSLNDEDRETEFVGEKSVSKKSNKNNDEYERLADKSVVKKLPDLSSFNSKLIEYRIKSEELINKKSLSNKKKVKNLYDSPSNKNHTDSGSSSDEGSSIFSSDDNVIDTSNKRNHLSGPILKLLMKNIK